jgi:hypothetical protein
MNINDKALHRMRIHSKSPSKGHSLWYASKSSINTENFRRTESAKNQMFMTRMMKTDPKTAPRLRLYRENYHEATRFNQGGKL